MKSYLALISDLVFSSITVFIILSVLLGYLIPYPFFIIFSVTITALFILFCAKFMLKKYRNEMQKERKKLESERTINALNLMDKLECEKLFITALEKLNYTAENKDGAILIEEENAVILLFFEFYRIKKADVVRAFNQYKNKKIALFSGEFSAEIRDFVLQFGGSITLYDKDKIYSFLSSANCLPASTTKAPEKNKPKFRSAVLESVKKVNSKKFFFFGLVFLFFSYFAPIKVYYLLCGSVFLAISLLCRLVSFSQKKN